MKTKEPIMTHIHLPPVTVVISTKNQAPLLEKTLESVLAQDYTDLEVIVIDAGSTDRTQEMLSALRDERLSFYAMAEYHVPEMLNRGVSLGTGTYFNFLYPGDYYLNPSGLLHMVEFAKENHYPDLVCFSSLIRDGKKDPHVLLRPLKKEFLRNGKQPTKLQACLIRKDVFEKIERFTLKFPLRFALDFFCRFYQAGNLWIVSCPRVFMDHFLGNLFHYSLAQYLWETWKIVRKHFGFFAGFAFLKRKGLWEPFLKYWLSAFRQAFWGK